MSRVKKIKVLVVDDSIVSREIISKGIAIDPFIEVVGTASDPFDARDKIIEYLPDVLTLDINMPKMDGITFLEKLMAQYPLPVVVISSSTKSVFEALEAGAMDFVAKPDISSKQDLNNFIKEIILKIKTAASAQVQINKPVVSSSPNPTSSEITNDIKMIAIGASTGGTEAILSVIKNLSPVMPGVVIVQHMPPVFTRMYAERLNNLCKMEVKEAQSGDEVKTGRALIAPGDAHMKVYMDQNRYYVSCSKGEKVSGHCPSVDVLFHSVADTVKNKSLGILLTGMGSDGAIGLMKIKKNGGYTIGQDEKTSVVYGMPMVAYNIGAVMKQLPLEKISEEISRHMNSK